MSKRNREKVMVSEHVMEVRHKALGGFLDIRGCIADYIKDKGLLPHWQIDSTIINFRDRPDSIQQEAAFVGYKGTGYIVYNPATRNYFEDKAIAFWKTLLDNQHYDIPIATRLGIRTKVFLPSKKDFKDINKLFFETFHTEKTRELLGGSEKDFQLVVDLIEKPFEVRFRSGPMHKNEAEKSFSFESKHFAECGVYFDIDYFKTENLSHQEVPRLVKDAIKLTWDKVERITSKIGI